MKRSQLAHILRSACRITGDPNILVIGEASPFHDEFGVYGQGVTLETATLPDGWRDRLVPFTHGDVGKSKRCASIPTTWCCRNW